MAPKPGDRVTVTVDVEYWHDARDHLGVLYVTHEGSTYGLPNVQSIEVVAPPKPEEPTGRYAIVIADGVVWCRAAWASDRPWSRVGTDVFADWAELDVTSIEFAGVDQ